MARLRLPIALLKLPSAVANTIMPSSQAARLGEPSYVWRAGQKRRMQMILSAAPRLGQQPAARVLENGCGLGLYLGPLREWTPAVYGLEYEFDRAVQAGRLYQPACVVCADGERLPHPAASFDVILSNEVIEHVQDDRAAVAEMVRALRPGGRVLIFCPNRWYPFETHGIFWRGRYRFGNIPLVNYLPGALRDRLVPHVRAYTSRELRRLFDNLPVRIVQHTRIFGGYDNLVSRLGPLGRLIRTLLHAVERTPLNFFGLSHFLVAERLPHTPRAA
jgi:SAM-dependent methyltransferase